MRCPLRHAARAIFMYFKIFTASSNYWKSVSCKTGNSGMVVFSGVTKISRPVNSSTETSSTQTFIEPNIHRPEFSSTYSKMPKRGLLFGVMYLRF
jgi:hypothetical protein